MKFRFKIMLCMLGLLSVLFGVGGSLLITTSFRMNLEHEQEAIYNAYKIVLNILQIINRVNSQFNYSDISQILEQLSGQNAGSWTALQLYSKSEHIYEYGEVSFMTTDKQELPGSLSIRYMNIDKNSHILTISGTFKVDGEVLYLDMARDISMLFETRYMQQKIYLRVFLLLLGLCAICSYSISRILTYPLVSLSKASRAIATGQLSSRVYINSKDEIGRVACDFNAMADALEENIFKLKDSVKRQERFMGSFAHEAKTPMTSIIGYADLIRGQTLSPDEQIEAANYIVMEGKRLENLSQKLLSILVIKKNSVIFAPVQLSALIYTLVGYLKPIYMKQGIILTCECEEGICHIEADLIKSLLMNLLDNACKAIEEKKGTIDICSKMLPDGCQILIQDSGRGISSDALEHLTEAFYRVDKSRSREQGGVGLGLSLCEEIVMLHNGNMQFESQIGQGTTVIVELRSGIK